jgi:hypothetical protein
MVDFLPEYFCLCKRVTWSVRGLIIGWITSANHRVAYFSILYYSILHRPTYLPGHRTKRQLVCYADLQRAALLLLPGELQVGPPLLLTPPIQITFPTTYIINISKSSRNSLNSECEVLVHRNYANQYNIVQLEN